MRLMKGVPAAVLASATLAAAAAQTRPAGNRTPTVTLTASPSRVVSAAAGDVGALSPGACCTPTSSTVQLSATATDPDGDTLLYTYSTTGGRVTGGGPDATLDLTGVAPGTYTVALKADDGRGGVAHAEATVNVERCSCSHPINIACPTVTVSCPDTPGADRRITYTASAHGGDPRVTPTFKWEVSSGTIISGQGTRSITVDASKTFGTSFTATVAAGGYGRHCQTSASCSLTVEPPLKAMMLGAYGVGPTGREKLLLDGFAVELRNDPAARGYLVCCGGRRGRTGEARRRCDRAKDYLVTTRGIDASRVVTVDGGSRDAPTVELWLVPSGAEPPP